MAGKQSHGYDAEPASTGGHAYDTPDVSEILQGNVAAETEAVAVRLTNRVRVDQLPLRVGSAKTINPSATDPEKVFNANPKRGSITVAFVAGSVGFRIATSREACLRDDSSYTIVGQQGPHKFHFTDEVWCMKNGAGAATDRIAFITEDWAR